MKDRDSEKSFLLSRRSLPSLTLLPGWPFMEPSATQHLRVGQAEAHLSFERGPSGKVEVHVLHIDGHLDVAAEGFEHER
jgi:hypothetical protein